MSDLVELHANALQGSRVLRLRGREGLNELPRWDVGVVHPNANTAFEELVGQPATLVLSGRTLPLLVTEACYRGKSRDGHVYELSLSASIAPLRLRRGYRIHQDATAQEVVAEVLKLAGIASSQVSWRLTGRYAKRAQCARYDEAEWAFVERLLGEEGISYWLDERDGEPLLVLGDSTSAHDPLEGGSILPFAGSTQLDRPAEAFLSLRRIESVTHDAAHVLDYDPWHPDVLVEGHAGSGILEHFEFPALVQHQEAADARAKVRLEQLQRFATTLEGGSDCARLQPGRVVEVVGTDDELFDGPWLVVDVEHEIAQTSPHAAVAKPYRNRVTLVPHERGGRAFRPAIVKRRPRIDGLETAVVTGPRGEEVHVDEHACIKLALPWDPESKSDETSSRWARTSQWNLGGSMMLPRIGWEVGVAYLDGNPDLPVALGKAWNGGARPPYPLPAHAATTALKSATSPGGAGSHEVRFADGKGAQEAFVHATNTQGVKVGGAHQKKVGASETHDVKKAFGVHVKGPQSQSIGGSQSVRIAGAAGVSIKGARSVMVGATETVGVKANHEVAVGPYTELVGGFHHLYCNLSARSMTGGYLEATGARLLQAGALGVHESCAGGRLELVSGSRNVVAILSCEDDVKGTFFMSSGAVTEKTAEWTSNAATADIDVKGDGTMNAGGSLVIAGASISIDISGSLTAKGGSTLEVGGGAKASGGKAKIEASQVLRKDGSKADD